VNDAAVQRATFPFADAVTDGYMFLYVRKDCGLTDDLLVPRHACEDVFFDVAADVAVLTSECSQRKHDVEITNAAQDVLQSRVTEMRRELLPLSLCGAKLRLAHRPLFDGDVVSPLVMGRLGLGSGPKAGWYGHRITDLKAVAERPQAATKSAETSTEVAGYRCGDHHGPRATRTTSNHLKPPFSRFRFRFRGLN
jgi:hypothetical protein